MHLRVNRPPVEPRGPAIIVTCDAMFLRSIAIENFRAVTRVRFDLDPDTTILIGENGSGKTSIFDALAACLGIRDDAAPVFLRSDFRPPSGGASPIRVDLTFEETEPGEWDPELRRLLGPVIVPADGARAAIHWRTRAVWNPNAEGAEVTCAFLDAGGEVIEACAEAKLDGAAARPIADSGAGVPSNPPPPTTVESAVAELRRRNPFLVFESNHRRLHAPPGPELIQPEEQISPAAAAGRGIEEFTRQVYQKLSESWESLTPEELDRARAAARRIWKRLVRPADGSAVETRPYHIPSGGAQSLGPLLVFGALLQAQGATPLDPDVDPILGLEHFGAHLHPATLGSVRRVLESLPVQKLISTYSAEIVSALPLRSLRRLVRRPHTTDVFRFREARLPKDDRRRLGYHIRARRGGALFDRCWLLVEGETEFWLLPEMARLCGYELDAEGIGVVEFAQCGVRPIIELANDLGIGWHLLADGDDAGDDYIEAAVALIESGPREQHVTQLPDGDIERYLWDSGYGAVYRAAAMQGKKKKHGSPGDREGAIQRAIHSKSKPFLALSVVEAARQPDTPGVPAALENAIKQAVRLARSN